MAPEQKKESDPDGWSRWQNFVLEELKSLKGWMLELSKEQRNLRIELATLKAKAGLWGAAAGMVPVAILLGINFLKQ